MPYTQAVLLEVQRWASVLPLIFPHAPTKTTKLLGYTIPKGTFTLVNAWGVHNDPQYWGDPEVFRPERFLNEKGEAVTPEYFIPFSAGKLCTQYFSTYFELMTELRCLLFLLIVRSFFL